MEVFKRISKKETEYFIIGINRIKYTLKNKKLSHRHFTHITASKVRKELKKVEISELTEFLFNHQQQKLF